jgi:hypothetical protein
MTDQTPIIVNTDQTAAQLGVALRYGLTTIGAYAIGKGWIDGDLLQLIVALATVIAPAAFAFYRSHQQKKQLVTIASAAPDSVAVVQ